MSDFLVLDADTPPPELLHASGADVVVSVPAGLRTADELFDALSELLDFPGWFGRNWNALSDLLRDLSWRDDGRLLLHHRDLPLEGDDRRIYLEVLEEAVASWRDDGARLRVSFPVAAGP